MGTEIISHLQGLGSDILRYLVPFVVVLSIVVFFHELGHFLVARLSGVRVLVFSIGFGPEIAGFYDRHGTRWKIAPIPLGGYVKFFGDETVASTPDKAHALAMDAAEREQSLIFQPLIKRAAIVAAGPIANFILAIIIFSGIFMLFGMQTLSPRVDQVQPGSPAAAAGFKPGDMVLSIDGEKIDSFADMQRIVSNSAGDRLNIAVERDGKQITLQATPQLQDQKDIFGNVNHTSMLGIMRSPAPGDVKYQPVSPPRAVLLGLQETWFVIDTTLTYVGRVIIGREAANQLGGPIRIAQMSGQVASVSFIALVHLAAVLSVSIGLLNLFPIPLLDGGHLLFYSIEALRGRPLSERAQEVGFRIGFAIVLMLMIFATFNDIVHLAAS
jgi:regulator of sigma E protease